MSTGLPAGYASLTADEQVRHLRGLAERAAPDFGIEPVSVELVLHAFNTTFKVTDGSGSTVAVRVNTNSFSTAADVVAQSAWMRDLARDTAIQVPVPRSTVDGISYVQLEGHLITAASWLEGPDVGECGSVQAHELGRTMALMHDHAAGWRLPDGGHLDSFTDPLFGDEDRLRDAYAERPADLALLDEAFARCSAAITQAASTEPAHVIHGDLHGGNLKWHESRLAVFDFDDCGIATPSLDLAIATFYLRRLDPSVEEALRAGYDEVRGLPQPADFEAIVASRQFLLANDLLRSSTPEFRDQAAAYLDTTIDRLTRWRESGRFTL